MLPILQVARTLCDIIEIVLVPELWCSCVGQINFFNLHEPECALPQIKIICSFLQKAPFSLNICCNARKASGLASVEINDAGKSFGCTFSSHLGKSKFVGKRNFLSLLN